NPAFGATPTDRWCWAFYLVTPPGLLLGVMCFFMPEPRRGHAEALAVERRRGGWYDYVYLLKIPSFTLNTLGMTAMNFGIGGLGYWMAAYLEERRKHEPVDLALFDGADPVNARTVFGVLTAASGLLATVLGGVAGDWLRGRVKGAYFLVSGAAMIAG